MNQNLNNYQELIQKLDNFIRKYYINKLIKGSLYSVGTILALFILFNVAEYYLYFGMGMRKMLFYSFLLVTFAGLGWWIVNPLVRYFKLGTTISHEDAARIIGEHFTDVRDKLLNILQLKKMGDIEDSALLNASIEQKTNAIRLVPFQSAIDLNKNRKYLRYALPPFLLLLFILFAAPSIITDGTNRIIHNDQKFARVAPFSYLLSDQRLEVVQFKDYELTVNVEGSVLPNEVYVNLDHFQYPMTKKDKSTFTYTFKNVQKDQEFTLSSGNVVSLPYTLKVLAKPNMTAFTLNLNYPSYVGRKDEIIRNTGDIVVPEGTKLAWTFDALNTDKIHFVFGNQPEVHPADQKSKTTFTYQYRAVNDIIYKLFMSNKYVSDEDSMMYTISVIKDQYPAISADKIVDSLDNSLVYFVGRASDDYGLNALSFNYTITKQNGKEMPAQKVRLNKEDGREIQFSHVFDLKKINTEPGDKVSFYFEVSDNDGVNGSKTSKTSVMTYNKPTVEEMRKQESLNDQAIKDELKDALNKMDKLQENMRKLREKLLQSKQLNWQDKKEMDKILEEHKKLQDQIEKAKQKLEENMKNQEDLKNMPEELKEQQEKLKELFDKAADPETKELMDKIQELLQELDKEDAIQMLDQFENSNDTKQKETNRLLELYKQLEMEKNIKDQIKDLEKLADQQEKLADKTDKQELSNEELAKLQEELNKKMDDLKKKQEELEKQNKQLSPPKDMGEKNQEQMDDAKKDMEKSKEQLDKKDNKAAAKSQKKAASKMKDQAKSMASGMEGKAKEQATEDIKTIRQLLENLVKASFDQENLFQEISPYTVNSAMYPAQIRKQFKLQNDFKVIEDTLIALSNRNPDIESYVMDKVAEIKVNFKEILKTLEERQIPQSQEKQRRTMKNLNDLALMMNESLDKAMQSAGMPGSGSCDKPGGKGQKPGNSKVPMDKITEGQQQLSDKLKEMQGKKDKGDKEGKGEKDGKGNNSDNKKEGLSAKDYAQAAAQQAALRKALEALQKEKTEQGKGSKALEEIIGNMDRIETELVNKRLNNETLKRMKDIETRLLEAEKAEMQRELDQKRESKTAEDKRKELPPAIQDYLKKRQAEIDMYKNVSPALRPYYKSLVDDYFKSLKHE